MNTTISTPGIKRKKAARVLSLSASAEPKRPLAFPPAGSQTSHPSLPAPAGKSVTVVKAKIDVGFGNTLFIRGQGDGLSWDKGQPLCCVDGSTWVWSTAHARDEVVFKLLLNDQVWARGDDVVTQAGKQIEVTPSF